MDRFEFRISPSSRDQWRRIEDRLAESGRGPGWRYFRNILARVPFSRALFRLPARALAGVGVVLWAVSSGTFPSVEINGVPVRAGHVLMLVDSTGSMNESGIPEELARQRNRLAASVSSKREENIQAFGLSSEGYRSNLLFKLSDLAIAYPEVDTVYVVSDFHPEDKGADCDNPAGLSQFQALIRKRNLRLYLSTVNMIPSPGLLAVADESGGGLIAKGAKSSSADRARICGPAE